MPVDRATGPIAAPDGALTKAITELSQEVTRAFSAPTPPQDERYRYVLALQKIAEFLAFVGVDDFCLEKLMKLALALNDLDQGTVSPLLVPIRPYNRRPDSSQIWQARANVALAIEARIRTGETATQAAAQIAKKFPETKTLTTKRAHGIASAAKEWHSNFKNNKVNNAHANRFFKTSLNLIATAGQADLIRLANFFCCSARNLAADLQD